MRDGVDDDNVATVNAENYAGVGTIDAVAPDHATAAIPQCGVCHADKVKVPYLCVAGEFDELSPIEHSKRLVAAVVAA